VRAASSGSLAILATLVTLAVIDGLVSLDVCGFILLSEDGFERIC